MTKKMSGPIVIKAMLTNGLFVQSMMKQFGLRTAPNMIQAREEVSFDLRLQEIRC
jgi:hypothetical protein